MAKCEWQIGIVGTFDVENYGDLLFPLIAEAELSSRLGKVRLHRFSYSTRTAPDWPFPVASVADLPERASALDGMLIGGGYLIRFDKEVAPGYGPPAPAIHHPTGYWLTPGLIALQHGLPLIWNGPGMHRNEIPAWAEPLVALALDSSRYIAVRDDLTREALARLVDRTRIEVVPDTAFGLPLRLPREPSPELIRLRADAGLTGPFLIVQAALGLESVAAFLRRHAELLGSLRVLALPIGPVLGDRVSILADDLPGLVRLPAWPGPLLLAELIRHAEAVIGHSYHLAVTALAFGVPAFTPQDLSAGKYSALRPFESIHPIDAGREPDPDWFFARIGRRSPSPLSAEMLRRLAAHWDRVAAALREGPRSPGPSFGRFWQALPGWLEAVGPGAPDVRAKGEVEGRRLTELARAEIAARDSVVAALHRSNSWKLTSPLRSAGRRLRGREETRAMIQLNAIAQRRLETVPYRWARIDGLFSPEAGAALAASYPRDHFKLLSAHGGEKDYEYEARSLIRMGAASASYAERLSPSWRAFAADLVSAGYRNAMSLLVGQDLSESPLEVNVFHYGPGCSLGAHPDLPDKVVTHVFYFNESWNCDEGGCLAILRSKDPREVVAKIPPLVGTSGVLVRSDDSWHAVEPVERGIRRSRRSVTVTFYRPGSASSMWPLADPTPLHDYQEPGGDTTSAPKATWWSRLTSRGR